MKRIVYNVVHKSSKLLLLVNQKKYTHLSKLVMARQGTRVPGLRQGQQDTAVFIDSKAFTEQHVLNPQRGGTLYGNTDNLQNFEARIGDPLVICKNNNAKRVEVVLSANGIGHDIYATYKDPELARRIVQLRYRRGPIAQTDIRASPGHNGKTGGNSSWGGTVFIPTYEANQVGQILQVAFPPPDADTAELAKSSGGSLTRFPFIYVVKKPDTAADKVIDFAMEILNDPKRFQLVTKGIPAARSYENGAHCLFEFICLIAAFTMGEAVEKGILVPASAEFQEGGRPTSAEETTLRAAEFLGVTPKSPKSQNILQRTGTKKKYEQFRQDILRKVLYRNNKGRSNARYEFGMRRTRDNKLISMARSARSSKNGNVQAIRDNPHGRLLKKQINCAQRTISSFFGAHDEDSSWDAVRVTKPGIVGSKTYGSQKS